MQDGVKIEKMSKTIQNNVEKLRTITVDEFFALNFNTLKDPKRNVVKLKNSIRKNGWSFPVFIWAGHDFNQRTKEYS